MQITWQLPLKLNLQVSNMYPRFLPHSSWRGVDRYQQWAGSTFGNSALVWDSKEASPCLLALCPLCHRCSQLGTATNTASGLALHCTAVLTGQETGMLGQTRCAPGLKQVKGQLSSLQQPQFHLPPPHHTQGSKTDKCCTSKAGPAALATAEQQQEYDSFKEEAKCKTQLHFFICIILSVSPQKP